MGLLAKDNKGCGPVKIYRTPDSDPLEGLDDISGFEPAGEGDADDNAAAFAQELGELLAKAEKTVDELKAAKAADGIKDFTKALRAVTSTSLKEFCEKWSLDTGSKQAMVETLAEALD